MKLVYFVILFYCYSIVEGNSSSCITPNGETAQCVTIWSCPILQNAFESKDPDLEKFVEDSACGNKKFNVCCGTSLNVTKNPLNPNTTDRPLDEETQRELNRNYTLKKLLPTRTYCGMQHYDDYFHESDQVNVDEFPWLLDLESQAYSNTGGSIIACSAVLISKKYALTSELCLVPENDSRYIYTARIKFGTYGWRINVTCIDTQYGDDCTEPLKQIYVEEKIPIKNSKIVLLRLKQQVTYTDFVRPLCLPMEDTVRPKLNETVLSSGWGREIVDSETSEWIKKRNINRIASEKECKALSVEPTQNDKELECVVAVGTYSPSSCTITTGSATMYKYRNNWYANGILQAVNCTMGIQHVERITPETVNFILENMKD